MGGQEQTYRRSSTTLRANAPGSSEDVEAVGRKALVGDLIDAPSPSYVSRSALPCRVSFVYVLAPNKAQGVAIC